MEVKVSLASKEPESITTAAGSVTAYSSEDISSLGYYTLYELADITPGYGSTSLYAEKGLETRGQTSNGLQNQKHLVLINGIPVNHARNYKAPVDNELPLFFADQVEFLRGPASALYGTSAFFGVISIHPKSLSDDKSTSDYQLTTGSVDHTVRFMSDSQTRTEHGESSLALGYYKKDASMDFVAAENETGNPERIYWDDQRSLFLYANHDVQHGKLNGFSIGSIVMSRESGLGELWSATNHQGNEIEWWTFIPYIKYSHDISNALTLNSYIKANYSREAGTVVVRNPDQDNLGDSPTPVAGDPATLFAAWDLNFTDYEFQLETRYLFSRQHSLISGINYKTQYAEGSDTSYDNLLISADQANINSSIFGTSFNSYSKSDTIRTTSIYLQDKSEYEVLAGLTTTFGFRWDQGVVSSDTYEEISPRISIVQKLDKNFTGKLLWGNALRVPTLKDGTLNPLARDALVADGYSADTVPEVKPETFETHELILNYLNNDFSAQITAFRNITENEITSTMVNNETFFINSTGSIKSHGYELEARYNLDHHFNIWANYSTAATESETGDEVPGVASSRHNLGTSYKADSIKLSIIYRGISGFTQLPGGDHLKGYDLVDTSIRYEISPETILGLQVKNLLDEDYRILSVNEQIIPTSGREFLLSFTTRI